MTTNMRIIRWSNIALSVYLLLLSPSDVVRGQTRKPPNDLKVEMNLRPEKETIILGEPMYLLFDVKNLSREDLCLGVGGDYRNRLGRPESFKVKVVSEDGAEVKQPEVVFGLGGFGGCAPIPSNETHTIKLFLAHWATIEKTGSYKVNVKRAMTFFVSNRKPTFPREVDLRLQADVTAEFKVVRYEASKMGEIINSLGSAMLADPQTDALDSARALAQIGDKRVIDYFAEALRRYGSFDVVTGWCETALAEKAVFALSTFDDDRALDALKSEMFNPLDDMRLNIATALSESPHKAAIGLLLQMQSDGYWFVRLRVAQGLKNVSTPESVNVLYRLLSDENEDVRGAARESLRLVKN